MKELLEIEEVLGSKLTFELLNEQILISDEIDIDSRYSRTKGYYSLFYNEEYNKIQNKTVLVLGAGALGCYISLSLSMYGVRKLIVADYDIIEPSNLNRQILYTESDVGKEKINVLSEKIHKYNSDVQVVPISIKVSSLEELEKIVAEYGSIDFIVKAIDTPIDIIKIVNQFAVSHKISYISGGFNGRYLIIDNIYIPTIGSCFGCRNINKDINKYTLSDKTKWPTTPEMPAILGGRMTNLIIKIFLGCYNEILIDNAYVYNMRNHALSQKKYVLENGECPICKKNNKVKDNNIRAKTFIRSVCFCLLSGGVAFLSAIGQFTVIETQLIVLFLGIIFAIYYAYYNKNIQTSLENIVWLFSSFEILFLLVNFRTFIQLPVDIFIGMIIFLMLWIFIMLGIVCLSYYITLLFSKEA
ncbi:HesA/MoeB/ThiF family protein [Streptococcus pneumoniae]|uniref:HesA/MoeB/ThiF family protein n=1 Tax=Streptococcus pneumoniae TaxID=1313 RepID=UPI00296688A2|nr:ThiF family adenylyltransferase [Streptococcus pneumoniae]